MEQQLPNDWAEPIKHRGFSRATKAKCYVVRLMLMGTQRYIGKANSHEDAARIYDLALWKCAPLIPGPLRPNYPAEFVDIIQRNIDQLCPNLNEVFSTLVKLAGFPPDWDEGEARARKLEDKSVRPVVAGGDYKAYRDATTLTAANTLKAITRLSVLRLRLNLTKLPEVAKLADSYVAHLEAAERDGLKLRAELAHYEKFYHGLTAPMVNADDRDKGNDIWVDTFLLLPKQLRILSQSRSGTMTD